MKELAGVYPYLVSPVDENGNVKKEAFTKLINHLINQGVHGLTPLGSTGEFAYLTWEQRKSIVETVVESADSRVPVVAGVAHTSVQEAVRQAREMQLIGADGILAIMDTYFPVPEAGVVSYFKSIAESVDLPVVLYTNPNFSGTNLTPGVLKELSLVPNIQYLKDASANTGNLLSLMSVLEGKMKVFSASAHIPLSVMMFGGVGWMSGPACVVPAASVKLYELAREKKWDLAIEAQKKLWSINRIFQKYSLAPCIKACLIMQGFDVGDPIPPLQPLNEQALSEVRKVLTELNVL